MSNADWYARKLGASGRPTVTPAPPPPGHLPGQLPPHLAPYAQQPAQPMQTVQQPEYQPQQTTYNASSGAVIADDGHVQRLRELASTGGTQARRNAESTCPNCGKNTLYTLNEGGVFNSSTGQTVKPVACTDCGYPAPNQFGSQLGAGAGVRATGPVKAARQLPANYAFQKMQQGGF